MSTSLPYETVSSRSHSLGDHIQLRCHDCKMVVLQIPIFDANYFEVARNTPALIVNLLADAQEEHDLLHLRYDDR